MPTINDPNAPKSKWPSGMTFVMYCAGVTMLLLAVSLLISGKPFAFSVQDKGVTLHGGLVPASTSDEKVKEKGAEFQQKFAEQSTGSHETAPTASAPFNGIWTGGNSTYELVQIGNTVILAEMTNGIITAYGTGTADGAYAHVTIESADGALLPIELEAESATKINITGTGIPPGFFITK